MYPSTDVFPTEEKNIHNTQETDTPEHPPVPLPVYPDTIPAPLKELPQWVVWQYEWRSQNNGRGKWTKPPFQPQTGTYAKANDPETWSSWDEVWQAYQSGGYDGIGFMFHDGDGLFGIDIDHCVLENDEFTPTAQEIVTHFAHTYSEKSPSGTGLRILGYGLPVRCGKGTTAKGIEVYNHTSPRYLTLTGHHLPNTSLTLNPCQVDLHWLHQHYLEATHSPREPRQNVRPLPRLVPNPPTLLTDAEVIARASNARNGDKFVTLWNGDGASYPSQHEADFALCAILAFWTGGDAEQIDRLFRQSGLMRPKWEEHPTYADDTLRKAIASCSSFYQPRPAATPPIAPAVPTTTPPTAASQLTPEEARRLFNPGRTTHLGNAERLIEQFGPDLHWVKQWGWVGWNGQKWVVDGGEEERLYKQVNRHIFREAANETDSAKREALWKWAKASESNAVMAGSFRMAQSEPGIRIQTTDFDRHEWLLNCTNGTLDLHTGQLLPHQREHLLTKQLAVPYLQEADCPTWKEKYLQKIFAGDTVLIDFLQKAVGYSLTGSTREHCLFILYGSGRNGKSTFINVLMKLLGSFAKSIEPEALTIRHHNPNTLVEMADLAGARLVTAVETEENKRLAEAKIKQMTGGDWIKACFKYKDPFDFLPVWKVWYATNHKPIIRGTDEGIWSRIRLIPFTVFLAEAERDHQLQEKLEAELPGILRWAVAGCLRWQQEGLHPPDKVQQATAAYRAEQDILAAFLSECCVLSPQATATAKDLYQAYTTWCQENGEANETQTSLGKRLAERGFCRVRITGGRIQWKGIGLLSERFEFSNSLKTKEE
ncbi:MAG: phage/plasmid primase, P4 family [Syntrophales bacterium LBB04]|nr:phage/plasmid primase, P4 family [Syntrophales bacterium LBB04]